VIRILNVEPQGYSDEARAVLRDIGDLVEGEQTREELLRVVPEFDVLIVRLAHQIDKEVLEAGSRLKAVVSATTGLDHIDTAFASLRNIEVLSLRGEYDFLRTIHATAEHTWGLLLALLRHIPQAFDSVCRGGWNRDAFKGHELSGKRLGILGLGRLGRRIAHYGVAFDMKVSAYDPNAQEWVKGVERAASVHELLAVSDVVSIHVPLDERTTGMIGEREFSVLRRHVVVINTSRGEVIDANALLSALRDGRIAGAALDVVPGERKPDKSDAEQGLLDYARSSGNLLITPHIAGATYESMAKTEVFMARKLHRFLGAPDFGGFEPIPGTQQ